MSDAPTLASPDDIPYDLAYDAYRHTSHFPEDRAERARADYAEAVNGFYAECWRRCVSDEQREILAAEMAAYREAYLARRKALLSGQSRLVSAHIAGPSNFPVRQMRKRYDADHSRTMDFLEWDRKARAAILRKIKEARPAEAIENERVLSFTRDIADILVSIHHTDTGKHYSDRSLLVRSIASKTRRRAMAGDVRAVEKAIEIVQVYNRKYSPAAIAERHKFWGFADLAREKAGLVCAEAAEGHAQSGLGAPDEH